MHDNIFCRILSLSIFLSYLKYYGLLYSCEWGNTMFRPGVWFLIFSNIIISSKCHLYHIKPNFCNSLFYCTCFSSSGRKIDDPELLEAIRLTIINNLLEYHPVLLTQEFLNSWNFPHACFLQQSYLSLKILILELISRSRVLSWLWGLHLVWRHPLKLY